jgi:hypothetical protein
LQGPGSLSSCAMLQFVFCGLVCGKFSNIKWHWLNYH